VEISSPFRWRTVGYIKSSERRNDGEHSSKVVTVIYQKKKEGLGKKQGVYEDIQKKEKLEDKYCIMFHLY